MTGDTANATAWVYTAAAAGTSFPTTATGSRLSAATPGTATPLGAGYFQDGTTLYRNGAVVATGISRAISVDGSAVDCLDADGRACTVDATRTPSMTVHSAVPLHSTPVGAGHFLAGNTLYRASTVVADSVTSAVGYRLPDGTPCADAVRDVEAVPPAVQITPDGPLNGTQFAEMYNGRGLLGHRYTLRYNTLEHPTHTPQSAYFGAKPYVAPHSKKVECSAETTTFTIGANASVTYRRFIPGGGSVDYKLPGMASYGANFFLVGQDLYFGDTKVADKVIRMKAHGNTGTSAPLQAWVIRAVN